MSGNVQSASSHEPKRDFSGTKALHADIVREIKKHSFYLKPGEKKRIKIASEAKRRASEKAPQTAYSAVLKRAIEVIGDQAEAMRWMGTPVRSLDYSTPISLLPTREGRKAVLATLEKLEHGVM